MSENLYSVYETNRRMVATNMNLDDALLLVKALMEQYYADPIISFTIVHAVPKEGE